MTCSVEARRQVRAAAECCGALPVVEAVDVLTPDGGPHPGWVLEVTVDDRTVPSNVLRELARVDLGVVDVTPQGRNHAIVTATA